MQVDALVQLGATHSQSVESHVWVDGQGTGLHTGLGPSQVPGMSGIDYWGIALIELKKSNQ